MSFPSMACQHCGKDTDQRHIGRVDIILSGRGVERTTYLLCTQCGAQVVHMVETQFSAAKTKTENRERPIDVEFHETMEDEPESPPRPIKKVHLLP